MRSEHGPPRELDRAIVGERTLAQGRAFDFVALKIRERSGVERDRLVVKHRGACVVLGVLTRAEVDAAVQAGAGAGAGGGRDWLASVDGRAGPFVLLVRNERHAIPGWLEELPAGGIEAGEPPVEAAGRELREETGFRAARLEPIGRFYTTPGITDELMHAFLATGLEHAGQDLDEDEVLERVVMPLDEFLTRAAGPAHNGSEGEMLDGKSVTAALLARARGMLDCFGV
ncbi:MAG: NUDIX hydrolase [Planctomycetota bacterium]